MAVNGKIIVITGASSGIGAQAAEQLAARGAVVCLVARRAAELQVVAERIRSKGGRCQTYAVDLADAAACDAFAALIQAEHPRIDVLVNNAGRSIRRPLLQSAERLHDFERTMPINCFAPLRPPLALAPRWLAQGGAHVVLSSTLSTQVPVPLFGAYLGSKAALESFGRTLLAEHARDGLQVSTVHFPMVRTEMSGKTAIYRYMPMMSARKAGAWIVDAVATGRARRTNAMGLAGSVALAVLPGPVTRLGQWGFRSMDAALAAAARLGAKP